MLIISLFRLYICVKCNANSRFYLLPLQRNTEWSMPVFMGFFTIHFQPAS